jgi:hypothetical protein
MRQLSVHGLPPKVALLSQIQIPKLSMKLDKAFLLLFRRMKGSTLIEVASPEKLALRISAVTSILHSQCHPSM